jgi:hypothetical protein
MKEIKKVKAVSGDLRRVIDKTAESCRQCRSRSDGDMVRVWLSCSSSVPSEHGVKWLPHQRFAPSISSMQQCVPWCLKEWKIQKSIDNWLPSMDGEVCKSASKCLKPVLLLLLLKTSKEVQPHPQTNNDACSRKVSWKRSGKYWENCCKTEH